MNTREAALDILMKVFDQHGYASLILKQTKSENMGFMSELVYGTIRQHAYLEYQWKQYASHAKKKTALLLDMSIYEMLFMHTEDYAVVDEANRLAPKKEKGFVNAILRNIQKNGRKEPSDLATKYSHPSWLVNMWKSHYGEEKTLEILMEDQKPGRVFGRINPLKFKEADPEFTMIDEWSFTSTYPIHKSEAFKNGEVLIQNPSSLLAVKMLDAKENMRVLDVCAAPGTKTQMIAGLMSNTGSITACDIYEHRVKLIDELMEKTGVTNVTTMAADATVHQAFGELFDRVLCDVPCSGLGDLRHKPEIKWNCTPESIDELIGIQKQILENASNYVKNDGVLVYSTCTLNKKENERQVAQFLSNHPEFALEEEKTIFPSVDGYDGFYAAKLRKKNKDMVE